MTAIGMIGLGRMGANMARRLARAGTRVHGHDAAGSARKALADETGVRTHDSLASLVTALRAEAGPAVVWLMLPAGEITGTPARPFDLAWRASSADIGSPVVSMISSARWMRCPSPGASRAAVTGSSTASRWCMAGQPCAPA